MLVTMINSVDEYVAGEEYDLDDETGRRFVALGYASTDEEHTFTEEELAAFREGHQSVTV